MTKSIPSGFCQCGCGQSVGTLRHQPKKLARFISGHNLRKGTERERFFSHVKMGKPDECWLWTGATSGNGYGNFDNKIASRVAYLLEYGTFPEELLVLHKCDTPRCVNPSHLFLGTALDNAQDMISKGRANRIGSPGSTHPFAKLTEKQVTEMRQLYDSGKLTQTQLALRYKVKRNTVSMIVNRVRWKHLP